MPFVDPGPTAGLKAAERYCAFLTDPLPEIPVAGFPAGFSVGAAIRVM